MSDTNNRNKQGPGLQSVRGDEGDLPDRGTGTGSLASYSADMSLDAINRLGGVSADSDPASPSKDMPPLAEKLGGGSHDGSVGGRMSGLGKTTSDDPMDVTPGDEGMPGDRD